MELKQVRAVYTDDTIRVYHAFNAGIAAEAVSKGTFGRRFMTMSTKGSCGAEGRTHLSESAAAVRLRLYLRRARR